MKVTLSNIEFFAMFHPEMPLTVAPRSKFARLDVTDESYVTKIILFSFTSQLVSLATKAQRHKGAQRLTSFYRPVPVGRDIGCSLLGLILLNQHPITNFHRAWLPDPIIIACLAVGRDIQ